jgi:hypothetical protein
MVMTGCASASDITARQGEAQMSELISTYTTATAVPPGGQCPGRPTLADGEYRLVIHIFIFDKAGRLLIQLRSPKKQLYGGKWDVSAGGHSRAGEDSAAAPPAGAYGGAGHRLSISPAWTPS